MSDSIGYEVRRASEKDVRWIARSLDELGHISKTVIYPNVRLIEQFIAHAIGHGQFCIIVAEHGDELVGVIGTIFSPALSDTSRLTCSEAFFWVDKEHRSSGVGRKLLSAAEQVAKRRGAASMLMIALESSSPEAVGRMYESRGYRLMERVYEKGL